MCHSPAKTIAACAQADRTREPGPTARLASLFQDVERSRRDTNQMVETERSAAGLSETRKYFLEASSASAQFSQSRFDSVHRLSTMTFARTGGTGEFRR
jgi:hypothetical protein